ncbi:hypothetical protein LCGC14_0611070 [marine sediment metagenome]|uniref:Uncharacterized protein n=1 Tax=marine sediment metagenome TaxID=412755 RepID=A0A0F9R7L7_9ZZZZ
MRAEEDNVMGDECGSEYGGIDDAMEEQALKEAEDKLNENAKETHNDGSSKQR